jgi:hypothetical protein
MKVDKGKLIMILFVLYISVYPAFSQSIISSDSIVVLTPLNAEKLLTNEINTKSINTSIEILITNDFVSSDLKVSKTFTNRFNTFLRYRNSINYKDKVSDFLLIDLCYNIIPHFDAAFEIQAGSNFGTIPRFGAQYVNTFNKLSCYLLYTYGPKDNTIELEHIFSYGISINQQIKIKPQIELIINYLDRKYNFIIARSRFGIQFPRYYFGFGADIFDTQISTTKSYGLFCQIEF